MNHHNKSIWVAGTLFGFGAVLCARLALGQERGAVPAGELYEIIVTAEKREADLQHTSVAVGVVSGGEIEAEGITQLDDALKNMVGVVVARTARGLSPTIRGVGPTLPTSAGGTAGVSSLFDGIYTQNDYAARLGYYDVTRIEVLRGPQGTLYGRNSEGGVIGLVSNNPTQKLEGSASVDVGNYNLVNAMGMLNVPLSSTLALRVAGSSVDRKGYLSNGQDDNRAQSVRGKLLFLPSEDFSVLLGGEGTRLSGEGPGEVPAFIKAPSASVAYTNSYSSIQTYDIDSYKAWAKLVANVGIGELTVLPAYQYQSDPKALLFNGEQRLYSPGASGGSLIERSGEVRLASNSGSPVTWVAGYYRYHGHRYNAGDYITTMNSTGNIIINSRFSPTPSYTYTIEDSSGLFAQGSVPITNRLRAIGGVRHSVDRKGELFVQGGPTPETERIGEWSNNDWKIGGEFDATESSLLYATVSTGYRPGGIAPQTPHALYLSEKLRAYEIGSKNQFLGNTLRINGSFYYSDYKNFQQSTTTPCGSPPLPACTYFFLNFNNVVFNVPVKIHGVELESQYLPTLDDSLTANLAAQRSRIDGSLIVSGAQLLGESLPNAPTFTFNGAYRHAFHLPNGATLAPEISPRYQSASYVTIPRVPENSQTAYWEWDASLHYAPQGEAWSVNAYIKNATDTVVKSSYNDSGRNASDTAAAKLLSLQSPRTYGISVAARF